MEITDSKNIVGEVKAGQPACIRFFGRVTEQNAQAFNAEFDYLENVVRPSLIRVLINCEGGSVLHGMSVFSTIRNATVPTECVNEGMAASMGSVLLAAGDVSKMRDYAILYIHNPFLPGIDDNGSSELVKAFANQIKTIYRKRFGLSQSHVEAIMDGQAGRDGTFFDAQGAVHAGIISCENIIPSSKQLCDKVKNEISGVEDLSQIQTLMSRISALAVAAEAENKPSLPREPIVKQNHSNSDQRMSDVKTNSPEYSAVAASLGLKDNYEVKDVMARISELMSVESRFKETGKALNDAQTVIAGRDATIQNLQKDLGAATASLAAYKQKEATEKAARIETMVEAAIDLLKIKRESKATWVGLAENNFDLVKDTLDAIPVPEQISKEIAGDPANIQAAIDATRTVEDKVAEQVQAVVGKDFSFKTIG